MCGHFSWVNVINKQQFKSTADTMDFRLLTVCCVLVHDLVHDGGVVLTLKETIPLSFY